MLLTIHPVHEVFVARIVEWFATPYSSGPCFVKTLHCDPCRIALHGMTHSFIEWHKPFCLHKAMIHEGGKTLMLGKMESKRGKGQQRMIWSDGFTDSMDMNLSTLWETVGDRGAWYAAAHGVAKNQTQPSSWTTTAKDSIECLSVPAVDKCFVFNYCNSLWYSHLLYCKVRKLVLRKVKVTYPVSELVNGWAAWIQTLCS